MRITRPSRPIWRRVWVSIFRHVPQTGSQRRYDPDLWVVEIEDKQGRHFITETVQA